MVYIFYGQVIERLELVEAGKYWVCQDLRRDSR
jgi:hypothetical protein